MLSVEHLSCGHRGHVLLKDVCFSVEPGEIVCLLEGVDLARQRFEHDWNVSLGLPGQPLASKKCIAKGNGLLDACFR